VRYILSLLLSKGPLALLLVLKEQGTLASLRKVLVAADLNRVLIEVVILEKGDDVLRLAGERQSPQPQRSIVGHLQVLILRVHSGNVALRGSAIRHVIFTTTARPTLSSTLDSMSPSLLSLLNLIELRFPAFLSLIIWVRC
jgi:hypothetical protein